MRVVTGAEMREIDKRAIKDFKIPSLDLMEAAGTAVADRVREVLAGRGAGDVVIFAGTKNNGGDGFVAARLLKETGVNVTVLILGKEAEIKNDALINLKRLKGISEPVFEPDKDALRRVCAGVDVVVDAIFGTGFHGRIPDELTDPICAINHSGGYVLAVDIPSGVDSDNGRADGSVVEADETVTFGAVKAGCVLYPGAAYTGKITVSPIGFPEKLIANAGHIETPAAEEMAALLPPRNPEAHKHAVGRVLVIAGSRGMTGAAALCAQAALRTGAGIVTLACPASLNDIFEIKLTEVMTHPLSETGEGALAKAAADEIIKMAADYDVVIVGPGLGNDPETEYVVKKIVEAGPAALLLDADGINALTGQPDILSACQGDVIITPHPGELARLTGLSAKEIEADRLAAAGETAAKLGVVTVLKGAASVIAAPDRRVSVNSTGNSGLATAGTGDVLSGLIGGLWSQHMRAAEAAILATYIHGLAGDMAAFDLTEYALLAGDLIEYTPEAFGATEEAMNRPIIRSEEM